MGRHQQFLKFVATFVILCLLAQDVAMALPSQTIDHKPQTTDTSEKIYHDLPGMRYEIPVAFGSIDEEHQGTNGKHITFILDAHDSLDAQKNIVRIIRQTVSEQKAQTVFQEGYEGQLNTDDWFGGIKDPAIRRKVSYYYLDQLKIGAAEFAHVNRHSRLNQEPRTKNQEKADWQLMGADDQEAYLENVRAFGDSEKVRDQILRDTQAIKRELKALSDKRFSAEAQKWVADYQRFHEQALPLLDYLNRWLHSVSADDYPLLYLILSAAQDIEIARNIQKTRPADVLSEIEKLEAALEARFFSEPLAAELWQATRAMNLVEKLAELKISTRELNQFKQNLKKFRTENLAPFLARAKKNPVVISKRWETLIQSALKFYELAHKRDLAVERALLRWNQEPGTKNQVASYDQNDNAVLVFGGFHREVITEILRRNGFSYTVVIPKIVEFSKRHQSLYREAMIFGPHSSGLTARQTVQAARPLSGFFEPDFANEVNQVAALAAKHTGDLKSFSLFAARGISGEKLSRLSASPNTRRLFNLALRREAVGQRPEKAAPRSPEVSANRSEARESQEAGLKKIRSGETALILRAFFREGWIKRPWVSSAKKVWEVFGLPDPRLEKPAHQTTARGITFLKRKSDRHPVWVFENKDKGKIQNVFALELAGLRGKTRSEIRVDFKKIWKGISTPQGQMEAALGLLRRVEQSRKTRGLDIPEKLAEILKHQNEIGTGPHAQLNQTIALLRILGMHIAFKLIPGLGTVGAAGLGMMVLSGPWFFVGIFLFMLQGVLRASATAWFLAGTQLPAKAGLVFFSMVPALGILAAPIYMLALKDQRELGFAILNYFWSSFLNKVVAPVLMALGTGLLWTLKWAVSVSLSAVFIAASLVFMMAAKYVEWRDNGAIFLKKFVKRGSGAVTLTAIGASVFYFGVFSLITIAIFTGAAIIFIGSYFFFEFKDKIKLWRASARATTEPQQRKTEDGSGEKRSEMREPIPAKEGVYILVEKIREFVLASPDKPVIIAVEGASGDGKSVFSHVFEGEGVVVLHRDQYFLPTLDGSIDWEGLSKKIEKLAQDSKKRVVFVEGFQILDSPLSKQNLFNFRIQLVADEVTRIQNILKRNPHWTYPQALNWVEKYDEPIYPDADLVLENSLRNRIDLNLRIDLFFSAAPRSEIRERLAQTRKKELGERIHREGITKEQLLGFLGSAKYEHERKFLEVMLGLNGEVMALSDRALEIAMKRRKITLKNNTVLSEWARVSALLRGWSSTDTWVGQLEAEVEGIIARKKQPAATPKKKAEKKFYRPAPGKAIEQEREELLAWIQALPEGEVAYRKAKKSSPSKLARAAGVFGSWVLAVEAAGRVSELNLAQAVKGFTARKTAGDSREEWLRAFDSGTQTLAELIWELMQKDTVLLSRAEPQAILAREIWFGMRPVQRQVLRLYYGVGKEKVESREEMAKKLGRNASEISEHKKIALERVRQEKTGWAEFSHWTGIEEIFLKEHFERFPIEPHQKIILARSFGVMSHLSEEDDFVLASEIKLSKEQIHEERKVVLPILRKYAAGQGEALAKSNFHFIEKFIYHAWNPTEAEKFMAVAPDEALTPVNVSRTNGYLYSKMKKEHGTWEQALIDHGRNPVKIIKRPEVAGSRIAEKVNTQRSEVRSALEIFDEAADGLLAYPKALLHSRGLEPYLDAFDREHYVWDETQRHWASKDFHPTMTGAKRLILGSWEDVQRASPDEHARMKNFVAIRLNTEQGPRSFYAFDDHGWSLQAYAEAHWRGEIPAFGNTQIFVDKHGDDRKVRGEQYYVERFLAMLRQDAGTNNDIEFDMGGFNNTLWSSGFIPKENHHRYHARMSWLKEKLTGFPSSQSILLNVDTDATEFIVGEWKNEMPLGLGEDDFQSLAVDLINLRDQYSLIPLTAHFTTTHFENENLADFSLHSNRIQYGDTELARFLARVAPFIYFVNDQPVELRDQAIAQAAQEHAAQWERDFGKKFNRSEMRGPFQISNWNQADFGTNPKMIEAAAPFILSYIWNEPQENFTNFQIDYSVWDSKQDDDLWTIVADYDHEYLSGKKHFVEVLSFNRQGQLVYSGHHRMRDGVLSPYLDRYMEPRAHVRGEGWMRRTLLLLLRSGTFKEIHSSVYGGFAGEPLSSSAHKAILSFQAQPDIKVEAADMDFGAVMYVLSLKDRSESRSQALTEGEKADESKKQDTTVFFVDLTLAPDLAEMAESLTGFNDWPLEKKQAWWQTGRMIDVLKVEKVSEKLFTYRIEWNSKSNRQRDRFIRKNESTKSAQGWNNLQNVAYQIGFSHAPAHLRSGSSLGIDIEPGVGQEYTIVTPAGRESAFLSAYAAYQEAEKKWQGQENKDHLEILIEKYEALRAIFLTGSDESESASSENTSEREAQGWLARFKIQLIARAAVLKLSAWALEEEELRFMSQTANKSGKVEFPEAVWLLDWDRLVLDEPKITEEETSLSAEVVAAAKMKLSAPNSLSAKTEEKQVIAEFEWKPFSPAQEFELRTGEKEISITNSLGQTTHHLKGIPFELIQSLDSAVSAHDESIYKGDTRYTALFWKEFSETDRALLRDYFGFHGAAAQQDLNQLKEKYKFDSADQVGRRIAHLLELLAIGKMTTLYRKEKALTEEEILKIEAKAAAMEARAKTSSGDEEEMQSDSAEEEPANSLLDESVPLKQDARSANYDDILKIVSFVGFTDREKSIIEIIQKRKGLATQADMAKELGVQLGNFGAYLQKIRIKLKGQLGAQQTAIREGGRQSVQMNAAKDLPSDVPEDVLRALPKKLREIYELAMKGWTYQAIAEHFGETSNAAFLAVTESLPRELNGMKNGLRRLAESIYAEPEGTQAAFAQLDERERKALSFYYGIGTQRLNTLEEIFSAVELDRKQEETKNTMLDFIESAEKKLMVLVHVGKTGELDQEESGNVSIRAWKNKKAYTSYTEIISAKPETIALLAEKDRALVQLIRGVKEPYPQPAEIAKQAGISQGQAFSDSIRNLKHKIRALQLASEGRLALSYVERAKINAVIRQIPDIDMSEKRLRARGLGILLDRMIGAEVSKSFSSFEVFIKYFEREVAVEEEELPVDKKIKVPAGVSVRQKTIALFRSLPKSFLKELSPTELKIVETLKHDPSLTDEQIAQKVQTTRAAVSTKLVNIKNKAFEQDFEIVEDATLEKDTALVRDNRQANHDEILKIENPEAQTIFTDVEKQIIVLIQKHQGQLTQSKIAELLKKDKSYTASIIRRIREKTKKLATSLKSDLDADQPQTAQSSVAIIQSSIAIKNAVPEKQDILWVSTNSDQPTLLRKLAQAYADLKNAKPGTVIYFSDASQLINMQRATLRDAFPLPNGSKPMPLRPVIGGTHDLATVSMKLIKGENELLHFIFDYVPEEREGGRRAGPGTAWMVWGEQEQEIFTMENYLNEKIKTLFVQAAGEDEQAARFLQIEDVSWLVMPQREFRDTFPVSFIKNYGVYRRSTKYKNSYARPVAADHSPQKISLKAQRKPTGEVAYEFSYFRPDGQTEARKFVDDAQYDYFGGYDGWMIVKIQKAFEELKNQGVALGTEINLGSLKEARWVELPEGNAGVSFPVSAKALLGKKMTLLPGGRYQDAVMVLKKTERGVEITVEGIRGNETIAVHYYWNPSKSELEIVDEGWSPGDIAPTKWTSTMITDYFAARTESQLAATDNGAIYQAVTQGGSSWDEVLWKHGKNPTKVRQTGRVDLDLLPPEQYHIVGAVTRADLIWADSQEVLSKDFDTEKAKRLLAIRDAWNYLRPVHRKILKAYYGIHEMPVGSIKTIATTLSITEIPARQLHGEALQLLDGRKRGAEDFSWFTGVPEDKIERALNQLEDLREKILMEADYGLSRPRQQGDDQIALILNGLSQREIAPFRSKVVRHLRAIAIENGWVGKDVYERKKRDRSKTERAPEEESIPAADEVLEIAENLSVVKKVKNWRNVMESAIAAGVVGIAADQAYQAAIDFLTNNTISIREATDEFFELVPKLRRTVAAYTHLRKNRADDPETGEQVTKKRTDEKVFDVDVRGKDLSQALMRLVLPNHYVGKPALDPELIDEEGRKALAKRLDIPAEKVTLELLYQIEREKPESGWQEVLLLAHAFGIGTVKLPRHAQIAEKMKDYGYEIKSSHVSPYVFRAIQALKLLGGRDGRDQLAREIGREAGVVTDDELLQLTSDEEAALRFWYGIGMIRRPFLKYLREMLFARTGVKVDQRAEMLLEQARKKLRGEKAERPIDVRTEIDAHELPGDLGFSREDLETVVRLSKKEDVIYPENLVFVRDIWFGLRPVQRTIVEMIFGLGQIKAKNLAEIQVVVGMVPQAITALRKQTVDEMRAGQTGYTRFSYDSGIPAEMITSVLEDLVDPIVRRMVALDYGLGVLRQEPHSNISKTLKEEFSEDFSENGISTKISHTLKRLKAYAVEHQLADPSVLERKRADMSARKPPIWTDEEIGRVMRQLAFENRSATYAIENYYGLYRIMLSQFSGSWQKAIDHYKSEQGLAEKAGNAASVFVSETPATIEGQQTAEVKKLTEEERFYIDDLIQRGNSLIGMVERSDGHHLRPIFAAILGIIKITAPIFEKNQSFEGRDAEMEVFNKLKEIEIRILKLPQVPEADMPVYRKKSVSPATVSPVVIPAVEKSANEVLIESFQNSLRTILNTLSGFESKPVHNKEAFDRFKADLAGYRERFEKIKKALEEEPGLVSRYLQVQGQLRLFENALREPEAKLKSLRARFEPQGVSRPAIPAVATRTFIPPRQAVHGHADISTHGKHNHAYYKRKHQDKQGRELSWQEILAHEVVQTGADPATLTEEILQLTDFIREIRAGEIKQKDKRLVDTAEVHLYWLRLLEKVFLPSKNPQSEIKSAFAFFAAAFNSNLKTYLDRGRSLETDARYLAYQSAELRIFDHNRTSKKEIGFDEESNVLYVLQLPEETQKTLLNKQDRFFRSEMRDMEIWAGLFFARNFQEKWAQQTFIEQHWLLREIARERGFSDEEASLWLAEWDFARWVVFKQIAKNLENFNSKSQTELMRAIDFEMLIPDVIEDAQSKKYRLLYQFLGWKELPENFLRMADAAASRVSDYVQFVEDKNVPRAAWALRNAAREYEAYFDYLLNVVGRTELTAFDAEVKKIEDAFIVTQRSEMRNKADWNDEIGLWSSPQVIERLSQFVLDPMSVSLWRLKASAWRIPETDVESVRAEILRQSQYWTLAELFQNQDFSPLSFLHLQWPYLKNMQPRAADDPDRFVVYPLWEELESLSRKIRESEIYTYETIRTAGRYSGIWGHGTASSVLREAKSDYERWRFRAVHEYDLEDEWAMLNIMIEGKISAGEGAPFAGMDLAGNTPDSWGPFWVLTRDFENFYKLHPSGRENHWAYVVPNQAAIDFFEKGLEAAVRRKLITENERQDVRAKLMTYDEFNALGEHLWGIRDQKTGITQAVQALGLARSVRSEIREPYHPHIPEVGTVNQRYEGIVTAALKRVKPGQTSEFIEIESGLSESEEAKLDQDLKDLVLYFAQAGDFEKAAVMFWLIKSDETALSLAKETSRLRNLGEQRESMVRPPSPEFRAAKRTGQGVDAQRLSFSGPKARILISRMELGNMTEENFTAFYKFFYQNQELELSVYGSGSQNPEEETRVGLLEAVPSAKIGRVFFFLDQVAAVQSSGAIEFSSIPGARILRGKKVAAADIRTIESMASGFLAALGVEYEEKEGFVRVTSAVEIGRFFEFLSWQVFAASA